MLWFLFLIFDQNTARGAYKLSAEIHILRFIRLIIKHIYAEIRAFLLFKVNRINGKRQNILIHNLFESIILVRPCVISILHHSNVQTVALINQKSFMQNSRSKLLHTILKKSLVSDDVHVKQRRRPRAHDMYPCAAETDFQLNRFMHIIDAILYFNKQYILICCRFNLYMSIC